MDGFGILSSYGRAKWGNAAASTAVIAFVYLDILAPAKAIWVLKNVADFKATRWFKMDGSPMFDNIHLIYIVAGSHAIHPESALLFCPTVPYNQVAAETKHGFPYASQHTDEISISPVIDPD